MTSLFDPIDIGDIRIRNRIGLSPMSLYASNDGYPESFDLIHYGTRSQGGAGIVFTGTVSVSPEGRITAYDPGLWRDEQIPALATIVEAIKAGGACPGVQIGHAGRKASSGRPWEFGDPKSDGRQLSKEEGGWSVVGASPIAYGDNKPLIPSELDADGIKQVISDFRSAVRRAVQAGFQVIELHGGHGYLINSFQSPISNQRKDDWGGSFTNRIRLPLEIIRAAALEMTQHTVLAFRLTMDDFVDGGWTVEEAIEFANIAHGEGVQLFDLMSFGGNSPESLPPWETNFTLAHAKALRAANADIVIAGSAQTSPDFTTTGKAIDDLIDPSAFDIVLLGRQLLVDPYWPVRAANSLKDDRVVLPPNYEHWLTGRTSR